MQRRLSQLASILFLTLVSASVKGTGQISDSVIYLDQTFSLIGLQGELPSPEQFGMKTEPSSTANWRGYYATYRIVDGNLELHEITINAKGDYLPIEGVQPDLEATKQCYESDDGQELCYSEGAVYHNLGLRFSFTGTLRLASGFIQEHYVHMGFQKASAFERVVDLSFQDGKLTKAIDRSKEAAEIRGKFAAEYWDKGGEKAVEESFSLDLDPLR